MSTAIHFHLVLNSNNHATSQGLFNAVVKQLHFPTPLCQQHLQLLIIVCFKAGQTDDMGIYFLYFCQMEMVDVRNGHRKLIRRNTAHDRLLLQFG